MKNQVQLTVSPGSAITVPGFCGMPIVGMNEIPGHIQLIVTDCSGYAEGIITRKAFPGSGRLLENLYKKCPSLFTPGDKGCFSIYGVNAFGKVCFGCAVYEGDSNSENFCERGKHLYIASCNRVNPYYTSYSI